MFFSQALLWKKGTLANLWLAAYCFKKLKKKQVDEIDIPSSVDQIMNDIQISYRILAYLLLGLVKIFSKKVDYLEDDCKEALKIVTESLRATYWTNPQKSIKHVKKRKDVPEPSDLTNQGPGWIETVRAQLEHDGFSVPDRFELDLFDLEIDEECDAPDTHQQRAHQDNTVNEMEHGLFIQEPYQRESGRSGDSDTTCFTPIRDIIPVEMIMDLDLDINELYSSTSSKKLKNDLNQEAYKAVDQGSTQSINAEDSNQEDETPEPPVICQEIPSKDKKSPSKDKKVAPNLGRLETEEPLNDEPHLPTDPGLVSPKLTVQTPAKMESARKSCVSPKLTVRTPAKREFARKLRKRKIYSCDKEIILSNEIMREMIHDASDLVCKRRKAPQTNLDVWRQKRFKSVQQLFTDPLIPCTYSKIQAPFHSRVSEYNTPEKLKRICTGTEPEEDQSGPHDKSADLSEPLTEPETEKNLLNDKSADISDSVHERNGGTNLELESLSKGPTPSCIERDLGSHEMDGSVEQHQQDSSNIWSVRTRYVAQHLREKFSELKKRDDVSCLSLEKILEGKRRKTCARFFYETLALKGWGLIDVKQEMPYGDIVISETPELEEQLRVFRV